MKVIISKRASASMKRIDAHWQHRADYPYTFADELFDALTRLQIPLAGIRVSDFRC